MSIYGSSFDFYKSGILEGVVQFEKDGVRFDSKGLEPFPVYFEQLNIGSFEKVNFSGDTVTLTTEERYEKYQVLATNVAGKEQEGIVWTLMNQKLPVDIVTVNKEIVAFLFHGREDSMILVKSGFETFTPLMLWEDSLLSEVEHGVNHLGRHDVPMRDGIHLATDIWLPNNLSTGEKVPTILIRTPYGRLSEVFGGPHMYRYVKRGFALVVQDTRGREDSEGEWIPMASEIQDGDDTLNWIASQAWSDGKVGMIGGSYGGFVQWAAAASGNPHLKAIISLVTAGTAFVDIPRKGGTLMSGTLAWAFMMADRRMNIEAMNRYDWDELLAHRPIKDIPQKALGEDVPFLTKWFEHEDNDSFWSQSDFTLHGDKINVPSLYVSGWYDDDGMGTTQAWELNQKNQRENQRLVLGPWYHNANSTRQIHDVQFGKNAIRYDLDILYQKWFDRFLKGIHNGVEKEGTVQYYVVGSNEWKQSNQWPPADIDYREFYVSSEGNANEGTGQGVLSFEMVNQEKVDSYQFNPQNAAPYLIDVSENECSVPEIYNEVELRDDVLVYTSAPLEEDVEIAGDVYAVLYASSSARDTDWVVRLTDVDENGNSVRLSDGIIRARYRHSFESPELLEPSRVEKYDIRMTKIANTFKKGHRIRVAITSGAVNLAFPNQNTGNKPGEDTEFVVATQKVFHNKDYPTHVKLPVVKA
ncbi:CocE/NonD family hydrolase [Ornithinibacillus salinisoli]|uniref:CocE/NonD family hydrolase n=1 Tax=Ornithinibacillus salinisoli TaxID=1848459 RepID=A0ABW4VYP5_9BACI